MLREMWEILKNLTASLQLSSSILYSLGKLNITLHFHTCLKAHMKTILPILANVNHWDFIVYVNNWEQILITFLIHITIYAVQMYKLYIITIFTFTFKCLILKWV